jgi:RimJ/RimL family protein N-acetyltransferase
MSERADSAEAPIGLKTEISLVVLHELTVRDSIAFFNLVQRNREWLTRYGDYLDLVKSTVQDIEAEFGDRSKGALRMGIWRREELVGRVDSFPVAPEAFGLGYWIGEEYSGRGYVTAACRAMMDFVSQMQKVKEYWAGVRNVNLESIGVVERLGFSVYEQRPEYGRYRLLCGQYPSA